MKLRPFTALFVGVLVLGTGLSLTVFASDEVSSTAARRQYPGGSDEQDLRVQTEMVDPALKTDRRTFEEKIMQNIFKKNTTTAEGDSKPSSKKTPKPTIQN